MTASQASSAAAASPDGIGSAQCFLSASQPDNVGGNIGQVQGNGATYGPLCTSYIVNSLTVKLWSKNAQVSNGQTIQRGSSAKLAYGPQSVHVQTSCKSPAAQLANWHTESICNGVNVATGQEESGYINSNHPDPLLYCK